MPLRQDLGANAESDYPYDLETPLICRTDDAWPGVRVLQLPASVCAKLGLQSRQRIVGEVEGVPVEGALNPDGQGGLFYIVSPEIRRLGQLDDGQVVSFRFRLDDPGRVSVPDRLARVLERNPELNAAWEALTPGRRRGLAHQLASAKTQATQEKRLEQLVDLLRTGTPPRRSRQTP